MTEAKTTSGRAGRRGETPFEEGRKAGDPLAEKHRSAHFDKNWRTVNYAKLTPAQAGAEPRPNRCRESDLMRADWSPAGGSSASFGSGKPYPAKFASFVGSPFHAEVERLPEGRRGGRRDGADD
jgi:hypothetical protein